MENWRQQGYGGFQRAGYPTLQPANGQQQYAANLWQQHNYQGPPPLPEVGAGGGMPNWQIRHSSFQTGLDGSRPLGRAPLVSGPSAPAAVLAAASQPQSRPPIKKALAIGCNYPDSPYSLKSCVNDAVEMKFVLQEQFGYGEKNVMILVDHKTCRGQWPLSTRQNIIRGMKWLTQDLHPGDQLFFHYSGHGTCSVDYTGEEPYNQCLMPTDYLQSGIIVDDDINKFLVRPLPVGCTLHALVDCCHSGTIMDLQFVSKANLWAAQGATKTYKGTSGGRVFQFAACRDQQKAHELENGENCCGAATGAFIEAVTQDSKNVTYASVLQVMRDRVKEAEKLHKKPVSFWKKLPSGLKPMNIFGGQKYQEPQLSSSTNTIRLASPIHL